MKMSQKKIEKLSDSELRDLFKLAEDAFTKKTWDRLYAEAEARWGKSTDTEAPKI